MSDRKKEFEKRQREKGLMRSSIWIHETWQGSEQMEKIRLMLKKRLVKSK